VSAPPSDLRFRVLGPVAVQRAAVVVAVTGRRERLLLAGLLAHRNEVVRLARLVDLVWGPGGEPSRNALQARVSHLRRVLGAGTERLRYAGDGYRLLVDPGECDDDDLLDAVGRATALLGAGRAAAAGEVLDAGLAHVVGEPYGPDAAQPGVRAAATRARELVRSARELRVRAALDGGDAAGAAVRAAELVAEQPLRQEARALLMRALDAQGRRAEALAVYDEGRRALVAASGLEPAAVLRAAHAEILRAERAQVRSAAAGPGVLEPPEMITWLAGAGHLDAALRLAVRCAWGWWMAGERGRGRRLLLDLLETAGDGPAAAPAITRPARVWAAALAAHERDESGALAEAERALRDEPDAVEALAMVLLADRRTERGEHDAARRLLLPARRALEVAGDGWGLALADLVTARAHLLRGATDRAEALGQAASTAFHEPPDPAGQLAVLDLLGYAAETRGDWRAALEHHQRALLLALHGGWPHAQCWQLLRLGSVTVLSGQPAGRRRIEEALAVARRLDSPSLVATARNQLALTDARVGDRAAAARGHRAALDWYRRSGSTSGVALTAAALARVVAPGPPAEALLAASWEAAVATRDPRAVAYTAESRALLAPSADEAARRLGVADALRAAAGRPRVPGEQPAVDGLAARVRDRADAAARGRREGRALARRLMADAGFSPGGGTPTSSAGRGSP
jgi:DNA-binding SARP family transcriptional activator